jgi:TP901 family phage tail tape measure protein
MSGQITDKVSGIGDQIAGAFNLQKLAFGAVELGAALTTNISIPLTRIRDESLTAFSGFEASMNRVQAMSGSSKEGLKQLEAQALALGSTTQFSAAKIATAMGDLASAGLSVTDIYKAVPDVLNFAAAGQMKLADAAKVATQIMHQYGMEAGDMGKIADVVAHAAAKSSAEVSDMGVAFTYFGTIAKQANISLAETAAAFEILADAGTRGSKAGTAMTAMIARLENPSKQARAALEELGISINDLDGKLLPLDQLIENLQPLLEHTGDGFKIFGKRFTEVVALIDGGAEKFRELTKAAEETSGAAGEMAKTLMQGYTGELKKFTDELDSMKVKIGESLAPAATAMLKNFGEPIVKMVGDVADGFRGLPLPVQEAGLAFIGIAQWAGPAITILGQLALAWPLISAGAATVAGAFAGLAPVALAAAAAFGAFKLGEWVLEAKPVQDAIGYIVEKLKDLNGWLEKSFGSGGPGGDIRMALQAKSWAQLESQVESLTKAEQDMIAAQDSAWDPLAGKIQKAGAALVGFNLATGEYIPHMAAARNATEAQVPALAAAAAAYERQQKAAVASAQASQQAGVAQAAAIAAAAAAAAALSQAIAGADREVQSVLSKVPQIASEMFATLGKVPAAISTGFSGVDAVIAKAVAQIKTIEGEVSKLRDQFKSDMPVAISGMIAELLGAEKSIERLVARTQAWAAAVNGLDADFAAVDAAIMASGDHTVDLSAAAEVVATTLAEAAANAEDLAPPITKAAGACGVLGTNVGSTTKQMGEFGRLADGAIRDVSKGLADLILNGGKAGDVFFSLGKKLVAAFLDKAITTGIKAIIGELDGATESAGKFVKAVTGIGGGGTGAGGAASGIAGGIGGAVNVISGVVGAISGVIGNFQMHNIASDTGKIEVNTRSCLNQLISLQNSANKWWPYAENTVQLIRLEGIERGINALVEGGGGGGKMAESLGRVLVPPLAQIGADVLQLGQALAVALNGFMLDFTSPIYNSLQTLIMEVGAFRLQAVTFLQAIASATIASASALNKPGSGTNYNVQAPNASNRSGNTFNVIVQGNSSNAYQQGQMAIQGINSQLSALH